MGKGVKAPKMLWSSSTKCSSLSFKASDYEAKVRKEAAAFELSSLPEDLRRQMKQLTYKQLEREELAELSAAISGTEIAQN